MFSKFQNITCFCLDKKYEFKKNIFEPVAIKHFVSNTCSSKKEIFG